MKNAGLEEAQVGIKIAGRNANDLRYADDTCLMKEGKEGKAKVGSQEIPGVTGKFGLGMRNEAGQRLIEFCQENALVIANTLFQQTREVLHMNITGWSTPKSD